MVLKRNTPELEIQNLTKACNEALILAILSRGAKHGYQLALELEEESGGFFRFNHGTLYPILHKLEKEGLIRGTWRQEGPKRKRKRYELTARGKTRTAGQVEMWRTFYRHFFAILGEEAS